MLVLVSKHCGLIFPSLSRDFSNVISAALSEFISTSTTAMLVVLVTSEYLQKLINSDSILFNYFILLSFTWSNLSINEGYQNSPPFIFHYYKMLAKQQEYMEFSVHRYWVAIPRHI